MRGDRVKDDKEYVWEVYEVHNLVSHTREIKFMALVFNDEGTVKILPAASLSLLEEQ